MAKSRPALWELPCWRSFRPRRVPARSATPPDSAAFDAVLAERARNGGFDYRGATGQDKKRLGAYLSNLGDADPAVMTADEKKAFLINAYNAMAIAIVSTVSRGRSGTSTEPSMIRKRVGGEMLTLDDIENRLRDMRDARIHFAIVCASKSCPPLAPKAYRPTGSPRPSTLRARTFVNDPDEERPSTGRADESRSRDLRLEPQGVRARRRVGFGGMSRGSPRNLRWQAGWKRSRSLPNSSSTTGRSTSPEGIPSKKGKKESPPSHRGAQGGDLCACLLIRRRSRVC